jgi:RimJ/RimL family protein N-acetyltransferase
MDQRAAEAFYDSAARSIHPLVRSWYDDAEILANVRAELADDMTRVDDVEAVREFQAAFPVPGVPAEAYANRVVRFEGGADVVAGIRHRPSTGEFFVDLVVASRPLNDADDVSRVAKALGREFAVFHPRWVRLYVADEHLLPRNRLVGDFVLAARVANLRALPASEAVALARRRPADVYDDYARKYADFHATAPRNEELANVEELSTLERWAADGAFFEVTVDGARAGYCAVRRESACGVRGWCAADIVLGREFLGRGLAASVHRRLAAAIDAAPGDAMTAGVHEENAPSWRSGLRAGYSLIGRVMRVPVT